MKVKLLILAGMIALAIAALGYSASLGSQKAQQETLPVEIVKDTAQAQTPRSVDEVKPDEVPAPPAPVIDPNGCEAKGQWYRADNNECIDKPAPVVESAPTQTTAPSTVAYSQPAVQAGSGDCSLVYNYPWNTGAAMRVCMQESGGNPNSANWSDDHTSWAGCMGSFGLMQINCSNGQLFDGSANMAVAFRMWSAAGGTFQKDWPNTCAKVGC